MPALTPQLARGRHREMFAACFDATGSQRLKQRSACGLLFGTGSQRLKQINACDLLRYHRWPMPMLVRGRNRGSKRSKQSSRETSLRLVVTPQVPKRADVRDGQMQSRKSEFRRGFIDNIMQICTENVIRNAPRLQRHYVLNARNAASTEKLQRNCKK